MKIDDLYYGFKEINGYDPYFGWCDVSGCKNEGSSGGISWEKTGHWTTCPKHSRDAREGKPQPKMKEKAIKRENSRDPKTGFLTQNRIF